MPTGTTIMVRIATDTIKEITAAGQIASICRVMTGATSIETHITIGGLGTTTGGTIGTIGALTTIIVPTGGIITIGCVSVPKASRDVSSSWKRVERRLGFGPVQFVV
jgi:hypothetical protein